MTHRVHNREEAWRTADKLFPGDYFKDEQASARAGYPIYKCTIRSNHSWISDLNTSLELNIVEGDSCHSILINIVPSEDEDKDSLSVPLTEDEIEDLLTALAYVRLLPDTKDTDTALKSKELSRKLIRALRGKEVR